MSKLFLRHGEVHNQKNIMYGDIPGYRLSEKESPKPWVLESILKIILRLIK